MSGLNDIFGPALQLPTGAEHPMGGGEPATTLPTPAEHPLGGGAAVTLPTGGANELVELYEIVPAPPADALTDADGNYILVDE